MSKWLVKIGWSKRLAKTACQNRLVKTAGQIGWSKRLAKMQDVCPLERNSFPLDDSVGRTKEIVKHLKKCPLFLKALYLHYNPFCFPSINDTSSYLIDKENVEAELNKYHVAFNETLLHVLKKKISITSFDQFRTLKYKIIFEHFLNHGVEELLSKLGDEDFVKALQGEVEGKLAVGEAAGVATGEAENGEINGEINGERPTGRPTEDPPEGDDPQLSTANQFLDDHIIAVKKLMYHLRENPPREKGKDPCVKEHLGRLSSLCKSTRVEEGNTCGADGVDTNGEGSNPREKKHPLPILTLQSIGNIHKYRLCQDLLQFIDKEVFPVRRKNEEENSDKVDSTTEEQPIGKENSDKADTTTEEQPIGKENLDRDEIMSIVIYTVIYLCCKMSIIKRLKNKNFHHKNYLNSSGEKSIFFFLENLDKHDLQNVNMMFLLLHFNNNLLGIFERMFNQQGGWNGRGGGTSLRDYLFIELGAGKANTTRWVKFIMDDLVEILERFFSRGGQRGEGGVAGRAALTGVEGGIHAEERTANAIEPSREPGEPGEPRERHEPGERHEPPEPRERCKLLIIERESLRNKKEKNFLMQMAQGKNQHLLRVKADISDFHLSKFIYFSENGFKGDGRSPSVLIPDIIQFYYYKGVYSWRGGFPSGGSIGGGLPMTDHLRDEERDRGLLPLRGDQMDDPLRRDKRPNDGAAPITEAFLRNNLSQLGTYFDVHVKKLLSFLTQGNNNLLRNFDCKKVTFLTKHLCGNGTDLALRMLVNNTKNRDKENYFILAPCCHHRCDVQKILGFKLLKELGIHQGHLQHVVRHMSGYASCDNQAKKTIGKKVKLLVDLARILHLLDEGLQHVYLIKYVSRSITIENYAIVFFNHRKLDLRNFRHF
ncbi:hypothetical protein PCYB_093660 [Plasmodium cynomolgi strain B]|uniref:tRNA:m(4)X modification enzyme TRM13 n=1 Tax=Plasmodium cynomolgi (strain B) TaxID=1120755 RepID=K6UDG9_PLACD|nr:hypothetical protein PCYB_093660 [Plasmodium cynomolgi strain B]GAB66581.1 hypothetical protein PCYB_093660 [Plasmodium cynomolgi strain B]